MIDLPGRAPQGQIQVGQRIFGALACLFGLAGCATGNHAPFRNASLTFEQADEQVAVGQSTRPEVLAALGKAEIIRFESGYEVWVYRGRTQRATSTDDSAGQELVILFSPSGTAKQKRLR